MIKKHDLKLSRSIEFGEMAQPVKLPTDPNFSLSNDTDVIALGWGAGGVSSAINIV